jgi:rhamnosyl/mannosyltransferase
MKDVEANLALVGSGPLEDEVRALVGELGIADRVRLFPPLSFDDLVSMYHACDVFCLPSVERSEAFGIVLLEAQACGKPCVSTELGTGTSYANLDGVTGLVVPPRNPEALARALHTILEDADLKNRLSEQARIRVEHEFTVQTMAARTLDAYRRAASRA